MATDIPLNPKKDYAAYLEDFYLQKATFMKKHKNLFSPKRAGKNLYLSYLKNRSANEKKIEELREKIEAKKQAKRNLNQQIDLIKAKSNKTSNSPHKNKEVNSKNHSLQQSAKKSGYNNGYKIYRNTLPSKNRNTENPSILRLFLKREKQGLLRVYNLTKKIILKISLAMSTFVIMIIYPFAMFYMSPKTFVVIFLGVLFYYNFNLDLERVGLYYCGFSLVI